MHQLMTIDAVVKLIRSGRTLAITGLESTLDQLPIGAWIGATMPYVKDLQDRSKTDRLVFVTELPARGQTSLQYYDLERMAAISSHAPGHGYSLVIVPGGSSAHLRYASEYGEEPGGLDKPSVGWIASVDETRRASQQPLVYFGKMGQKLSEGAVVAHVRVPEGQVATDAMASAMEPEGLEVLSFTHGGFSEMERRAPVGIRAQPTLA